MEKGIKRKRLEPIMTRGIDGHHLLPWHAPYFGTSLAYQTDADGSLPQPAYFIQSSSYSTSNEGCAVFIGED